jgi:uncharacterized protein YfaS (alpha-2-macroglobulin family)
MKALCRVLAILALLAGLHAAAPVAAQTRIWFNAQSGTFRTDSPVRVDIDASHDTDVEAALVSLTIADVVAIEKRGSSPALLDLVRDRRAAATIRTRIAAANDKDGNHRADFGRQRPGFYAFRLRAQGELAGAQLLAVTSIGFVLVDTGAGPAAYALDLRTLRPRSDVTFDRYSSSGERAGTARAGADGLAVFDNAAGTDTMVVVASGGDAAAVMRVGSSFNDDTERRAGYVQTDRPIYRPGDRVYYRAVARTGAPGAYTVPTGMAAVTVRDPAWKELASMTPRFDTFGTVAGELQLADDATLGQYQISVWGTSVTFAVEAYKKPEYVVDVAAPRFVVGGDAARFGIAARYFFGRPAAGMRLHYRASFRGANTWWRRGSPFGLSGTIEPAGRSLPPDTEGDLVADAGGRATVTVPTRAVDDEKLLEIEVDARDATGSTVTAGTRTGVTPASFYLTIGPRRYFVAAGDTVDLDVRSLGYGTDRGRGGAAVTVAFARDSWVDGSWRHEELPAETATVTTDAAGKATVRWKPPASGSFTVTATTRDERGRAIANRTYVWVAAQRYDRAYAFGGVTVVPQSSEYAPGRRASVLVTVPQADVGALVQVTGGKHDQLFARHLPTQATALEIEPPADVAHYDVTVYVPTAAGMQRGRARIDVSSPPHLLHVSIAPSRAKYAPGDRASFAIRVAGTGGTPVRAQVGLGVVDDAIFALREASNADPFDALYGPSTIPYRPEISSWSMLDAMTARIDVSQLMMIGRTNTRSSAGAFRPGTTTDAYSVTVAAVAPPGKPAFDKLRNDFRDTAYWSPAVVTGSDGRATVTFRWPDSLTSFTASGVAVSEGSDIGKGAGTALVAKDFLVRLGAPRFLRRGDAARITAVAQGTPRAKTARLRFSAPELGMADATTTVSFDAHASANARWDVRGGELGTSLLRLAGTSGALSDGLQMRLPVESALSPERVRAAGSLPAEPSVVLDIPRGAEAGALRIDLAPSLLAQLVADVQLLQVYPYYCVEQTMSAALPAVQVDRLRKQMALPPIEGPEPGDVATRAVNRLVKLQHSDGSWGWWENDAANPFMTAYALYGLTELSRGGFAVPPDTVDRGAASLVRQIAASGDTLAFWGGAQSGSEWNTRAFMLYALADAKPGSVDRTVLAAADAQAKKMNPYALAALGLAHLELSDRPGAEPVLAELRTRVTDEKTSAHWHGASWHYRWMDDPIETTAYAVRFVHAMAPADPLVMRAVTWLRAQQHGSWFETTKDTAAAIAAIAEVVPVSPDELKPHETIRVTLNGREVKRVRIDTAVLPRDQRSIAVPVTLLRGGGVLRFEREGTGGLSWSTEWLRYVHERSGMVAETPFRITRLYASERGNTWRVGDQVDVDVTVVAAEDSQYVAIEDPLPAGLEYQPRQHESGDDWSGLQFFDDRVLFFATRVSSNQPLHFRYTLRATTAGTFAAPAPSAYAMYGPPNTSTGLSATVTIR